jgi:CRISPR-associated protein Cas1
MQTIIDIGERGARVTIANGRLAIAREAAAPVTVPLADVAAVLFSTEAVTVSGAVLAELARLGVSSVFCRDHAPVGWLASLPAHERIAARQEAQLAASRPLRKRLWQALVRAKIAAQARVCEQLGLPEAQPLAEMAARVRSGDPDNREAVAAQRYWPALFGRDFRRERGAGVVNAGLNYGYTVLRCIVARAIASAGVLPSQGLAHRSASDGLCLADDLMEPLRPQVDWLVHRLALQEADALAPEHKRALVAGLMGAAYVSIGQQRLTGPEAARQLTASLVESYENGKAALVVPGPLCAR